MNGDDRTYIGEQEYRKATIQRDGEKPVPIPSPIPHDQIPPLRVDASVSVGEWLVWAADGAAKKVVQLTRAGAMITRIAFLFLSTLYKMQGVKMDESKKWWQSKTVWGILLAAICTVLQLFGVVSIPAGDQQKFLDDIWNIIVAVIEVIGWILAIIGRVTAKKAIA